MVVLASAGYQAEALQIYEDVRSQLDAELGVPPGPVLRDVHAKILREEIRPREMEAIHLVSSQQSPEPAGSDRDATEPARFTEVVMPAEEAMKSQARPERIFVLGETTSLAALGAAKGHPAQLPTDIADFTGREEYVRRLSELLTTVPEDGAGAVRIALVAGSGGLGKTSLAVHLAHRLSGQFPDGQLYVDLLGATASPVSPGPMCSAGSCVISALAAGISPSMRQGARLGTGPAWLGAASWWSWTTRRTRLRCGRCCPAVPPARC